MTHVVVSVIVTVMEHHDQRILGRKGFIWLPHHYLAFKEARTGTHTGQELEAEAGPWRGAAYWLTLHDLLSLLSYRTQDHS